jgi:ankyrin repeat protein
VIYWHICKIAKVLILSYQYAAAYGHTDTVQALLAHGADVNAKENRKGTTALFFASVGGHTEMVRALLVGGADVNAKSNNSFTALMAAEMKGNTSIVHLLRNAGAIRLH